MNKASWNERVAKLVAEEVLETFSNDYGSLEKIEAVVRNALEQSDVLFAKGTGETLSEGKNAAS